MADAEKLFTEQGILLFSPINANLLMPRVIIANQTVVLFNLDDIIYEKNTETTKSDIEARNPWCKVTDVFKFKKTKGIKIVLFSSNVAEVCLNRGLLLFQLHIPGVQIKRERYRKLTTCFRCYRINDHLSPECPQRNSNFKVCSNCAESSHTWRECKSKVKKCINCGEGHSAMSDVCPVRQQLLRARATHKSASGTTGT